MALLRLLLAAVTLSLSACSALHRGQTNFDEHPDAAHQLQSLQVSAEEQTQILTLVFSTLAGELHASDLPAYLRVGTHTDPPANVIAALGPLEVAPYSLQPPASTSHDGIAGTVIYIMQIEQVEADRILVSTGVMAGRLAGRGQRFTLIRRNGQWHIADRAGTWIS